MIYIYLINRDFNVGSLYFMKDQSSSETHSYFIDIPLLFQRKTFISSESHCYFIWFPLLFHRSPSFISSESQQCCFSSSYPTVFYWSPTVISSKSYSYFIGVPILFHQSFYAISYWRNHVFLGLDHPLSNHSSLL